MATHSSVLAWRSPWTEEPGGLQSVGSQRVGHDLACTHSVQVVESDIEKNIYKVEKEDWECLETDLQCYAGWPKKHHEKVTSEQGLKR